MNLHVCICMKAFWGWGYMETNTSPYGLEGQDENLRGAVRLLMAF